MNNWFIRFLSSSIGKKLIMSLTGLFLITFLLVHLGGNLQLLNDDEGKVFNLYAKMMTTNPLIKFTSYGLYFFILLHAVQGLLIWAKNRAATGTKYAVRKKSPNTSWASSNMALLGVLILVFLGIHMGDFWFAMKYQVWPNADLGNEMVKYTLDDETVAKVKNLYAKVNWSFSQEWIVIVYIISMIGLAFHLWHGFASAFQTLGLNHKKYTPFIESVGKIFSIVIPALFALIPILYYLGIRWPFEFHFI